MKTATFTISIHQPATVMSAVHQQVQDHGNMKAGTHTALPPKVCQWVREPRKSLFTITLPSSLIVIICSLSDSPEKPQLRLTDSRRQRSSASKLHLDLDLFFNLYCSDK